MRVGQIRIENYRSHLSTDISFDKYTALIGANGAGKSSVFYALQWFFDGGPIALADVNSQAEGTENSPAVSVGVTFVDLTDADRARLGEYGRGEQTHFTRTWTKDEEKSKVYGNAVAGPGFPEIRRESRVTFKRKLYATLRSDVSTLPDLGSSASADAIDQSLADWESDPANSTALEKVDQSDANHLFGINGKNVIRECVRLILVPAATDISANVGVSGKGSTLSELIGAVTAAASAKARAEWSTRYAAEIAELNNAIREGVESATASHATRINSRLVNFVPEASIQFSTVVPDWTPKGEPSVSTQVTMGSTAGDLANQGHGTQRAVMIAMFQAMAPDEATARAEAVQRNDEGPEEHQARLESALKSLPTLLICIEEPEIYQHPVRARAFARVLSQLAEQSDVQVAVATHSPYFVRPTQFESLRRLSLREGRSSVSFATLAGASLAAGVDAGKFRLTVERHLPSVLAEGFFADAVVLVEGDTDKVCLEGVAEGLGFSLDLAGVSVLHVGGKNELRMACAILTALDVPVYVIADGDADRAAQKHEVGTTKYTTAHASNAEQTSALLAWLPPTEAKAGTLPYTFGDATVITAKYAVWRDDLESELSLWPSFIRELKQAGGALRDKKVFTYRAATLSADSIDVPSNLRKTITAIQEFAQS
jgi:putative ATP-dependent endonuclease of OLD family